MVGLIIGHYFSRVTSEARAEKAETAAGDWGIIERRKNISAMIALGFDGFYVQEDGKNLAVFDVARLPLEPSKK